jgi:hypothetical protein
MDLMRGGGTFLKKGVLPPPPNPPARLAFLLHLPRLSTDGEAARREFVPATGRESIVATKK